MGTVYQPTYKLKDGSNRKSRYYWIRYSDERGKRHLENSGYTTKDGARALLTERLAKIHKGEFAEYAKFKDITLKQVTDGLRTFYKEHKRRSIRKVERNLDNIDKFFGDTFRADTFTAERLADYRAHRLKEGMQAPTIAHEMRSLKTALRLALRDGHFRIKSSADLSSPPSWIRTAGPGPSAARSGRLAPLLWLPCEPSPRCRAPHAPCVSWKQRFGRARVNGRKLKTSYSRY